jgi:hypothetical protein
MANLYALFGASLPMPFLEEAMMHIHTGIPVSVGFIATMQAPEQFSPVRFDALALLVREPLPQASASRAIL